MWRASKKGSEAESGLNLGLSIGIRAWAFHYWFLKNEEDEWAQERGEGNLYARERGEGLERSRPFVGNGIICNAKKLILIRNIT